MKKRIRQEVLMRANNICQGCGSTSILEVHHIISTEELNLMGAIDKNLKKNFDQPDFCLALCRECHSTTFLRSPDLLSEERNVLKVFVQGLKN